MVHHKQMYLTEISFNWVLLHCYMTVHKITSRQHKALRVTIGAVGSEPSPHPIFQPKKMTLNLHIRKSILNELHGSGPLQLIGSMLKIIGELNHTHYMYIVKH